MNDLIDPLCGVVLRHCRKQRQETIVPGLMLYRFDGEVQPAHLMYHPRICVVLKGSKTVVLGGRRFEADPGTFLLVTADLPVTTQMRGGRDGEPHLGLTLDLDRQLLADVLQESPPPEQAPLPGGAFASSPLTSDLLQPLARLVGLLDRPDGAGFLQRLVTQERYFRMLRSPLRDGLVQFTVEGSHLAQIGRVTRWISQNYSDPTTIEALADIAGMSVTSFHRHFRRVTLMTPLQYRTQIRLQEARRLLVSRHGTAGTVGLTVGYESQSQFTRDYKRMFGLPPRADARRIEMRPLRADSAMESN